MMERRRWAILMTLKPECVETYLEYHRNVWPALEAAYREAGFTDLSCYVSGTTLIVTIEADPATYDEAKQALSENSVEREWQALMKTLRDDSTPPLTLDEVYRFPVKI